MQSSVEIVDVDGALGKDSGAGGSHASITPRMDSSS
jgi:hypothetical protein